MQLKYLITLVSALGLTQAQLPNLPDCSLNCFLGALQNDGCSSLTNFTCHCAVPSLVGAITPCVQGACDIADQASVSNAVTSVCSSAGVPVSIPPVTGTTTAAGSATTTASGSTTPSRTSSSSSAVGGASSGSSATSPSNSQTTSASTSTGTGASSGGSTTGTTTSTTTSTGAAHSTGAAVSVSAPFVGTGVLAMGVAAVFALC